MLHFIVLTFLLCAFLQKFFEKAARRFRRGEVKLQEACGDFQLLHRRLWHLVRGYWEWPTYGHFDTVLQLNLESEGVAGEAFVPPFVLFHQFHKSGGFAKRVGMFVETDYTSFFDPKTQRGIRKNPNGCDWGHAGAVFAEREFIFGGHDFSGPRVKR